MIGKKECVCSVCLCNEALSFGKRETREWLKRDVKLNCCPDFFSEPSVFLEKISSKMSRESNRE